MQKGAEDEKEGQESAQPLAVGGGRRKEEGRRKR